MSSGDKLTVGGEDATKVDIPPEQEIDISNRDPEQINQHLKVSFEEIFAEPHPTIFSFDKVWTLSYQVFKTTKLWCYRIITLICAIPCAFCWAINFAWLSFCNIWVWVPYLRAWSIKLWCVRQVFEPCMSSFIAPCFLAFGKILSNITITIRRE